MRAPLILVMFLVEIRVCLSKLVLADVENVAVMAGLHTGSEIAVTVESLHTEAAKIKYQRFHQFHGLETDDFKEALEKLLELKECYQDEYI